MKNINRFLANAWRSDLFGFNMASRGITGNSKSRHPEQRIGNTTPQGQWEEPRMGMSGTLCLGHQVPVENALKVKLMLGDNEIKLHPVRNFWTPAYMDTTYRSEVDSEYYPNSGTFTVSEKKCILKNDTFISHVKITNQRQEPVTIAVKIFMPFAESDNGIYTVDTATNVRGLRSSYPVLGSAVLRSSAGKRAFTLTIPAKMSASFRYAMAFSPKHLGVDKAVMATDAALALDDPFMDNEKDFNGWFSKNVPELKIENDDILKIYYYRFYVIYRSIHAPSDWIENHPIPGLCMYESPYGGWFGTVIGLPIAWQLGESHWLRDFSYTKNQINNWSNKCVNHWDYIQFTPWAIWQFYKSCPDKEWLASIYDGVKTYCSELVKSGCPRLTRGSWVTGAEYQPAFYQYTDKPWDWRHDIETVKLHTPGFAPREIYRVDDISYSILSLISCAKMAGELGYQADKERFMSSSELMIDFIKDKLWDDDKKFFYGLDPSVNKRCDMAACYDGFAPFMDGIVGYEYSRAFDALFDEEKFMSEYGVLTVERSCPMFWYDNCIAGPTASSTKEPHEYGCSWNGPVWPYANSVVLEGFGSAAKANEALRGRWLQFFEACTELHFIYGDRSTQLICEHYRPDDGGCFSPFFEYFHSGWIDFFMKYYAGIDIGDDGTVNFAPFTNEPFELFGVRIGDKLYDFIYDGNGERKINTREID